MSVPDTISAWGVVSSPVLEGWNESCILQIRKSMCWFTNITSQMWLGFTTIALSTNYNRYSHKVKFSYVDCIWFNLIFLELKWIDILDGKNLSSIDTYLKISNNTQVESEKIHRISFLHINEKNRNPQLNAKHFNGNKVSKRRQRKQYGSVGGKHSRQKYLKN